MVARFIYRLFSLFFFLLALLSWLVTAAALYAQSRGFNLAALSAGISTAVLAFMMHQCSSEAWRAARIHHIRYD